MRRAFDTAVRTKPPAFAAGAGAMHIQWREGLCQEKRVKALCCTKDEGGSFGAVL